MANIAFLGLGAMGSRMARHLVAAGHAVTVWNRTPEPISALVAIGARAAETPRSAVAQADFALAMVRDDTASRAVWLDGQAGALSALQDHAIAIECSTLSLDWVRSLAGKFANAGRAFLDAPVAGSRPQAEQKQLIFMAGGTAATLAAASPVLELMGAAIHHAGHIGAGTAVKLAVNALFGIQLCAMAELLEWLRQQNVDPSRALEVISATPVCSPAAKVAGGNMLAGAFSPMFPISLVEKDFGYACAAAAGDAPMTTAAHKVFTRALTAGLGADNITAVVQLYREI